MDNIKDDSIMFRIIQIAENNNKLSDDFKNRFKNVPWLAIKGMRNKIVHNYGVVDSKRKRLWEDRCVKNIFVGSGHLR